MQQPEDGILTSLPTALASGFGQSIIADKYALTETPSGSYPHRTEWNVRDSDGTVIFTIAGQLTGGSLKTWNLARKLGKPAVHLSLACTTRPDEILREFIRQHNIKVLNVAGSQASKEPGVYDFAREMLSKVITWQK